LRVPTGCAVVLANGTIEATRLALTSLGIGDTRFGAPRVGNLMAHLRSNITVRIRRTALGLPAGAPPDLETLPSSSAASPQAAASTSRSSLIEGACLPGAPTPSGPARVGRPRPQKPTSPWFASAHPAVAAAFTIALIRGTGVRGLVAVRCPACRLLAGVHPDALADRLAVGVAQGPVRGPARGGRRPWPWLSRVLIAAGDLEPRARNGIHRATPPVPENTVNSVKRDVATAQERSKR
jgi:hypothetical protein